MRESMDIKLEEDIPDQQLIDQLNSALPPDIHVYRVSEPVMKPGKIAFASFEILLEPEDVSPDEMAKMIEALFQSPEIIVSKHTKAGPREINLRPNLSHVTISTQENKVRLSAILPAGSTENINPNLLITAIETHMSCRFYTEITRTNLFNADMQEFA